jgi:ABC-2 type transport system permease protein
VVAVVGAAIAAVTGGWIYLPSALVLAVAGLGAGLSTANVISVRFPFRMPESRSPFSGSGGGQGCATSGLAMLGLLALGIILAPIAIVVALGTAAGPGWLLVASVPTLAYGALLWWFGLSAASGYGRAHEPERIAAVDPARAT